MIDKWFSVLCLASAIACGSPKAADSSAAVMSPNTETPADETETKAEAPSPVRPISLTMSDRVQPPAIPLGEYSGISWIGGNRYAVVNDKSTGSGLWTFVIPISDDGAIGEVRAEEAAANASGESSADSEGVTYLSKTGTVLVSREGDQTVREFSLDGKATGRQLAVPAEFAKDKITANYGFESLTSSAATGLVWTTTEKPLKADESSGLLRLQSFSIDKFKPVMQVDYRMENPEMSASEAKAANAYVFGVPALAALDDGRLLVLEREVYVPNGSTFVKALSSFTLMRIFLVDPVRDDSSPLKKVKVAEFSTSALNLANFEGMCLGPTLKDGSRALLLIADSQNGKGGLVSENIWLMKLKFN